MDYAITLRLMQLKSGFTLAQRLALLETGRLFKVRTY